MQTVIHPPGVLHFKLESAPAGLACRLACAPKTGAGSRTTLGKLRGPSEKRPLMKAEVSNRAKAKVETGRTADCFRVSNFGTDRLAAFAFNEVMSPARPYRSFPMFAKPTPLQRKAFKLLEIDPE